MQPHPSGGIPMDWSATRPGGEEPLAEGPDWIGDLLRFEAARHEPDRDRILSLMAAREHDEFPIPATVSSLDDRRRDQGQRARRAWHRSGGGRGSRAAEPERASGGGRVGWPLVAASVAVLTMATVAGARVLAPQESDGTDLPTPAATSRALAPPVTINGPQTAGPTTAMSSRATSASRSGAPSSTWTAPNRGAQMTSGKLSDAVSIQLSPTGGGTQLALPRSSTERDWIAVGARQDGKLVRRKDPTRALGDVTVSGYGPSIVYGPYQVSWTGGVPEQNRAIDGTWQSITAVDGRIRITAPLHGDALTIDLFAGTVRTTGMVRVQVGKASDEVTGLVPPCGTDICADIITVTVDSAKLPGGGRSGDLVIDLGPARPGDGLGLGLAAVVLR
jgi:hypothetical protein